MKKLTQKEISSISEKLEFYLPSKTGEEINELTEIIVNAIDQAEGYPAPPDDKYLDAKDKIVRKINELNGSIKNAITLGLTVGIVNPAFYQTAAQQPPMLPGMLSGVPPSPVKEQINPEFKIGKVTKEF